MGTDSVTNWEQLTPEGSSGAYCSSKTDLKMLAVIPHGQAAGSFYYPEVCISTNVLQQAAIQEWVVQVLPTTMNSTLAEILVPVLMYSGISSWIGFHWGEHQASPWILIRMHPIGF